jgi:WD40 repeat protein
VWDINTGECLRILEEHTRWIWSVVFSADGQVIASASGDGTLKLWETQSGQCLATLPAEGGFVSSVAFSPTQNLVAASCGDYAVRVWDYSALIHSNTSKISLGSEHEPLQLIHTLRGHSNRVWCVAFSPQGHLLASGAEDCQVHLWDVQTGQSCKTLQGHRGRIQSVTFNPQAPILASGSYDETVKLWDIDSGDCLKSLQPLKLYEDMNISSAIGLTEAQKETLKILGAIET